MFPEPPLATLLLIIFISKAYSYVNTYFKMYLKYKLIVFGYSSKIEFNVLHQTIAKFF